MAIERLALLDEVNASTDFAINQNSQDYRVKTGALVTYLRTVLSIPAAMTTQYAAPSATAFNVAITAGSASIHLILTPVAGYADGTITLPIASGCVDGQEVLVNCTQSVTTLVVAANGATAVTGEPAALTANSFFRLKYDAPTSTWYRVG